jgi:anthranilate phosphoribosyltransferase
VSELLDDGRVTERVISPDDFGVARIALDALRGGDAAENAAAIATMLGGGAHPALPAVILNAGAALAVLRGGDLRARAAEARDAIASGKAKETLDAWRAAAQRAKETG